MKVRLFLFVALVSVVTLLIGCGGGGGQTTNTVAAGVSQSFGSVRGNIGGNGAIEGIPVFLVAAGSSVPPQSTSGSVRGDVSGQYYSSVTLAGGAFQFTSVVPGTYNLIAQKDRFTGGILQNIVVTKDVAPVNLTLMLTPTGQVSGTVSVPSSVSASGIVAYVLGTSYSAFTDGTGNYTIIGVPVGTYTVGFNGSGLLSSVVNSVFVAPGAATTIPMQAMAINTAFFDPNAPGGVAVASQYATLFTTPVTYVAENASFPVVFSHYTHVSQYKENCFDCHTNSTDTWPLAPGATLSNVKSVRGTVRAMVALKSMAMTQMYAGKYCGKCHNGSVAFDAKANCSKCHTALPSNGPANVRMMTDGGPVDFSHTAHVDSFKKTCNECHSNNNPFPMQYSVGNFTMADMYTGKSCGKCHTGKVGEGFSLTMCNRCHTFDHNVAKGTYTPDTCATCHDGPHYGVASTAGIINEFINEPAGTVALAGGHNVDFIVGHLSGIPSVSCAECHFHEATQGKAYTAGVANAGNSHGITCQTCHWDSDLAAGGRTEHRLRKEPSRDLCATCHHARYTYGLNPQGNTTGDIANFSGATPLWAVAPWQDPGFPTMLTWNLGTIAPSSMNATNSAVYAVNATFSIPVTVFGFSNMGNLGVFASSTVATGANYAADAALRSLAANAFLGLSKTGVWSGGSYPHDSPQYDMCMGTEVPQTKVQWRYDLLGAPLLYNDGAVKTFGDSCVRCHMDVDIQNGKFGHTFLPTEATCNTAGLFNVDAKKTEIGALVKQLGTMLDADKDGTINWTRSGSDADLKVALNSTLASSTKLILLGVAWNYNCIEAGGGEGAHNYEYIKSMLTNNIAIMKQLKANSVDKAFAWWF
ncbi:MAG: hypothetical protein HQM09_14200 [Candidatus Riflebacteria bacterium]|nr:hypothetical protein [Candidatus Riflebacteria bacterium]